MIDRRVGPHGNENSSHYLVYLAPWSAPDRAVRAALRPARAGRGAAALGRARACSAAGSCCAASPSTRTRSAPPPSRGSCWPTGSASPPRSGALAAAARVRAAWSRRSAGATGSARTSTTALGARRHARARGDPRERRVRVRRRASSRCCSAACCWSSRATSWSPGAASAAALAASLLLGRAWLASGFDPGAASVPRACAARPSTRCCSALVALVVTAALTALGALLVAALVVVPAATVRLWTSRLPSWQAATRRAGRGSRARPDCGCR